MLSLVAGAPSGCAYGTRLRHSLSTSLLSAAARSIPGSSYVFFLLQSWDSAIFLKSSGSFFLVENVTQESRSECCTCLLKESLLLDPFSRRNRVCSYVAYVCRHTSRAVLVFTYIKIWSFGLFPPVPVSTTAIILAFPLSIFVVP